MGWDAFAIISKHKKRAVGQAMKAAADLILKTYGTVDGGMVKSRYPCLDLSDCAHMLERALPGESMWPDERLVPASTVQAWAQRADWSFIDTLQGDDRAFAECARAFLDICAAFGCGIDLSY